MLQKDQNVDLDADIEQYVNSPTDEIPLKNLYFKYSSYKSSLVFGETDVYGIDASKKIFDDRLTSPDGLEFLHKYQNSKVLEEYMYTGADGDLTALRCRWCSYSSRII